MRKAGKRGRPGVRRAPRESDGARQRRQGGDGGWWLVAGGGGGGVGVDALLHVTQKRQSDGEDGAG